jgi:hypothetical protein
LDWADLKDGHLNRLKHEEMCRFFQAANLQIANYRFSKHLFQPLVQIGKHVAMSMLRRWKSIGPIIMSRENSTLNKSPREKRRLINSLRGVVNAWSCLDLILFGKWQGGAVYYRLVKS